MSSKKIDYYSYGNTIDGTNYCSGVETLAENVIEENEADSVIVYPSANGWARLRSESYRMTTDNSAAVLPLQIYRINKVLINIKDFILKMIFDDPQYEVKLSEFKNSNGNSFPAELDITDLVLPVEEWNALPIAASSEEYIKTICKDNTFYWENGKNSIPFLGTVYTKGTMILGGLFADNTPTFERLIKYVLYQSGADYSTIIYNLKSALEYGAKIKNLDVREWQYRIEYVPLTSGIKMRSRKRAETNVDYMQPFNQRAEVNAASAFGKNMYLTAQKTGVREITVVKNYTRLKDIPPLGAIVRHNGKKYRLIANKKRQTNTVYLQVTHTLSEDWTSKSKHVAVDQKYRNWNIPQDMIWRNLYWEDYLCISKEPIDTSHNVVSAGMYASYLWQAFKVSKTNDTTINTLAWEFYQILPSGGFTKRVVLPCSTMGIGNSIVISASMKDQLSAGLAEVSENLCEEVLYCNSDGTLTQTTITLSTGIANGKFVNGTFYEQKLDEEMEKRALMIYPESAKYTHNGTIYGLNMPMPLMPIFNKSFYIYKTAGEAIKFTYQVHLTPYDSDIVVGNALAEYNPLIKKWTKNRKFKVWLMRDYLREGEDIIAGDNATVYTQTADGQYFQVGYEGNENILRLNVSEELQSGNYVGWCITDDENRLYLGCNSTETTALYFTMQHKRK